MRVAGAGPHVPARRSGCLPADPSPGLIAALEPGAEPGPGEEDVVLRVLIRVVAQVLRSRRRWQAPSAHSGSGRGPHPCLPPACLLPRAVWLLTADGVPLGCCGRESAHSESEAAATVCSRYSAGLVEPLVRQLKTSARSSTDRASDYGSEGWGFESLRARQVTGHLRSWSACHCCQYCCLSGLIMPRTVHRWRRRPLRGAGAARGRRCSS
jgi:hypothetical protein